MTRSKRLRAWPLPPTLAAVVPLIAALFVLPPAPRADSATQILEHRGGFVGAKRSKIVLNVVIKNGTYSKIKDARFRRVPISCDGDSPVEFVHGHFLGITTHGPRFRYRGGFGSATFRDSEMLFYGEIRNGGAKAKGKLRWRFFDHAGNRCNTGLQRWKTHIRGS